VLLSCVAPLGREGCSSSESVATENMADRSYQSRCVIACECNPLLQDEGQRSAGATKAIEETRADDRRLKAHARGRLFGWSHLI